MCLEYWVVIGFLLLPLLLGPCAEEERDENWRRRSMRESYWRVEGGGGGGGRRGNFVRSTFIRKFACVVGCFGKGGPFRVAGCFGKGGLFVNIVASIVCSQIHGERERGNVSDYTD